MNIQIKLFERKDQESSSDFERRFNMSVTPLNMVNAFALDGNTLVAVYEHEAPLQYKKQKETR